MERLFYNITSIIVSIALIISELAYSKRNDVLIDANEVSVINSEGFKSLAIDNGVKIRNLKISNYVKL